MRIFGVPIRSPKRELASTASFLNLNQLFQGGLFHESVRIRGDVSGEYLRALSEKSLRPLIDVGEYLGYSKPSVSRAMSALKSGGYVTADKDGSLHLTQAGLEVAKKIYTRHTVLSGMLMRLGVDEKTATEDACRIEHVISDVSFAAIQKHAAGSEAEGHGAPPEAGSEFCSRLRIAATGFDYNNCILSLFF